MSRKSTFKPPQDVNFGVWYPTSRKAGYVLQQNTLQYDKPTATITFKLSNKKDNNELTFTEQAVPESFAVAPDAFDKQVAGLQQATKFDSVHGSVAITRPFGSGNTTAIMRSEGTLIYVYSSHAFSTDDWRSLFNQLELVR